MNKALKKTLLIFGMTVVIFAAVSIFSLMLQGCSKTEEPASSETPQASTVPEKPSEAPKESKKPEKSEEPAQSAAPGAEPTLPKVDGKCLVDFDGDGKDDFSVNTSGREYVLEKLEGGSRFYDAELMKNDGKAFVEYRLIAKKNVEQLLPRFADEYVDYSDIEFVGETGIGSSGITGEQIIATGGETALSAWLIDTETGVFAVTFVYPSDVADSVFDGAFGLINSTELFLKIKK